MSPDVRDTDAHRGLDHGVLGAATSEVAESVAPALIAAFTAKAKAVDVSLGVGSTDDMAAVLQERLADVAIGPSLTSDGFPRLECSPLFRSG